MTFTLQWGIMATGGIATNFATDLLQPSSEARGPDDVKHVIAAVASSSSVVKAQEFLKSLGASVDVSAYGSYDELVRDNRVQIVYIATPQSRHYTDVLSALDAGKHVLCEKPFTINAKQAAHLVEVAKAKSLFLMEAAWTRFFPHTKRISNIIHKEERLGRIKRVFADFSLAVNDPGSRLHDPALGGGALLDLGFYPITWASLVLTNHPENRKSSPKVDASVSLTNRGVDEFTSITLTYENLGAVAHLTTSLSARTLSPYCVTIQGEKGNLLVSGNPANPPGAIIQIHGQEDEAIPFSRAGNNMIWEADATARAIRDGKLCCDESPMEDTLEIMRIMDEVRRQGNFTFPSPLEEVK